MKKKLLMCLSIALIAAMAITGTMAYFTDTDSDANVMTLGNVDIDQIEQERDADGNLVDFKQAKPAFPAVGEVAWNDAKTTINGREYNMFGEKLKNVVDKIISVKNTGKSDTYFRTIIAIEDPFAVERVAINVGSTGYEGSPWYSVEIDGVLYSVKAYTYTEALKPGETSLPSLLQAYLKSDTTNEDAALLGDTWDILALSQAVQTAGFDDAATALNTGFGEVNAENIAKWFDGVVIPSFVEVANADDLAAALANAKAGQTITLAPADYGFVSIDSALTDVTIKGTEGASARFNILGTAVLNNVTFTELNLTYTETSAAYVDGGAINIDAGAVVKNLVIENSTINATGGRSCVVGISEPSAEVTITNCEVTGPKYLVYSSAPIAKLTVEGCQLNDISSWLVMMNAGDSVGAQLTVTNNTIDNCTGGVAKYLGSSQPEGAFTVFTDNTLTNSKGHDGKDTAWFTIPGATATVTVSGNTLDGADWTPGTAQGLGK